MNLRSFSVLALTLGAKLALAGTTYLALGDSVAYGLHPATGPGTFLGYNGPSNGDRGYVGAIADALGVLQGARPAVINLSIPGESSAQFFNTSNLFRGANTNYGLNPFAPRMISQFDFAQEKIAALGTSIDTVSFALGANDFLQLDGSLQGDPSTVNATLALIGTRYSTVLTSLRTQLPTARLILPGYYNPYLPSDPRHAAADPVIKGLNDVIKAAALAANGRYVDFYTPIEGNQASLIYPGDIHPNDDGYAALGRAAVQAVPEPSTWAAVALGMVAIVRRRTRRS